MDGLPLKCSFTIVKVQLILYCVKPLGCRESLSQALQICSPAIFLTLGQYSTLCVYTCVETCVYLC